MFKRSPIFKQGCQAGNSRRIRKAPGAEGSGWHLSVSPLCLTAASKQCLPVELGSDPGPAIYELGLFPRGEMGVSDGTVCEALVWPKPLSSEEWKLATRPLWLVEAEMSPGL